MEFTTFLHKLSFMININTYITEKLHLNKDIDVSLPYPVLIQFYADWKDIMNLRDEINQYTNISEFGLEKLSEKSATKEGKEVWLYEIEITNKNDLLWFLIYNYGTFSNDFNFEGKQYFEKYINNYDEVKEYIDQFSNKEYQNRIGEYLDLVK